MAKKKPHKEITHSDKDLEAIERAIAEQLPGWQLARKQSMADATTQQSVRGATRGASLEELRRKFLPADEADNALTQEAEPTSTAPQRRSVLIEPKDGGPAKIADIVNGKVKIVQG